MTTSRLDQRQHTTLISSRLVCLFFVATGMNNIYILSLILQTIIFLRQRIDYSDKNA